MRSIRREANIYKLSTMKYRIGIIGALGMVVVVLSGCATRQQEGVAAPNEPLPVSAVQEVSGEDEYVVAPSDYIDTEEIITKTDSSLVSKDEKEGLVLMREEEKLARDVYATLYEKWGVKIFTNIAQSEQTHMDAVKTLLDMYNIADPVTTTKIGVFTDNALQKLYNDLVQQGSESLVAALTVGATIEDLDISDLNRLIAQTNNQNIIAVYENLTRGSRNHMRAFTRQLTKNGASYTAQYISQSELEVILGSPQEKGSGNRGQGGNRGNGYSGRN